MAAMNGVLKSTAIGLVAVAASCGTALATGQCNISGSVSGGNYHAFASYEHMTKPHREIRIFEVEIEISRRAKVSAGDTVVVLVDGKKVGALSLEKDRNGDLEIDLKYNSLRTSGPNQFPANFPKISNSQISVKIGKVTLDICTL